MQFNLSSLSDRNFYADAGIELPAFDVQAVARRTERSPVWVHFGAGNIYRALIAHVQQRLLDQGLQHAGLTAVVSRSSGALGAIWAPHDNLTMLCSIEPDGATERCVIGSISEAVCSDDRARLRAIFESESLQIASFTITEKGYRWEDEGETPDTAQSAMAQAALGLLWRYEAGKRKLALLSLDNVSGNGDVLRASLARVAAVWEGRGLAPAGFAAYVTDEELVAFPISMIDKIVPRPSEAVQGELEALGFTDLGILVTSRHTHMAPFVNCEVPEYLVVEDRFPAGRPPLERAGVYVTDRATVSRCERMKVMACLNPVHTALAVFGCLLGFTRIADEMNDPLLRALAEGVGREGMRVTEDPGIIRPEDFFRELMEKRFVNPALGDSPQRIACDTSQKLPIRIGETIKRHMADPSLGAASLRWIPLVAAGWLRYLLGTDDSMRPMALSPDPMLPGLSERVRSDLWGVLGSRHIFGVDLVEAGLAPRIKALYNGMRQGPGAVRACLTRCLQEDTQ